MTTTQATKVYIIDDHAIVREGLKQILADTPDITVAGDADTADEALILARQQAYNVLLLDITMPARNGLDILKQIKKESPTVAVLMLSMHDEDQYAIRSLKAGAAGYLNKQGAPTELVDAIREVAAGRKYITAALAQTLANQVSAKNAIAPHEELSHREYQTMIMIASGKCVSDIAIELDLSVKTVSMYRARLLQKMQLKNNAEIMRYAMKNSLV